MPGAAQPGPYGKGLSFQDAHFAPLRQALICDHPEAAAHSSNRYQVWELPDPEYWTCHGYACVRVDGREIGRSPGVIDLFSERETRNFHDCIEWARASPGAPARWG